jgi:hypothetical protein
MTNGVPGALYIMITAVVISVLIMMQFAVPVVSSTKSFDTNLGLSFNSYRFMLLTENHLSNALIFEATCQRVFVFRDLFLLDGGSN